MVTELIEGGGAYMEPQRLGASGASWTQTSFRLGDADVTDPDRTGFAMFYPNLDALQAVSVTTAGLHPGGYGSGTSVMLVPRMPAPTWQRTIEFYGSPPALQSVNPLPNAPSIARLRAASGASFVLSGPVTDRLGVHVAGLLAASSRLERDRQDSVASRTGSLSAHLVYTATPRDDVRLFVVTDQQRLPAAGRAVLIDPGLPQTDRSLLLSSTWNRISRGGLAWSANLAYGYAASTPALSGTSIVGTMERLRDGTVDELASSSEGRRHRTSVSWRGDPGPLRLWGSRHRIEFGSEASWTAATRNAPGDSLIGELVDGQPARAWQYTTDGVPSRWGGRELALWATDGIPITSSFDIDLALRASASSATRDGASADIRWRALSPAMSGTWRAMPNGRFTLMAGYARYAPRLPLNYLRFGDPHALTGTVHRWTDRNQDAWLQPDEVGLTIAAVGPCCANGRLNTIAADLHPPSTKEIRAAIETRLTDHLVLRLGGTDRRQRDVIQPVNRAYRADNYSVTYVEDPGLDSLNPDDDQMLPIFNRRPASFGTDSYVLQNVDGNIAMDHGVDLVLERVFDGRWGMIAGATAHKSNGTGGNRGFRSDENDQGVLGEVFSDPNASTHARGRLFFERGYADQVVGNVPAAVPAPWRNRGPLPGWAALLTSRARRQSAARPGVHCRATARSHPIHLRVHARHEARATVENRPPGRVRNLRGVQSAEHEQRGRRGRGERPGFPGANGRSTSAIGAPRLSHLFLTVITALVEPSHWSRLSALGPRALGKSVRPLSSRVGLLLVQVWAQRRR